jgi:hypothetical protein
MNILNYLKVQKVDITKACILRFLVIHYAHNHSPADPSDLSKKVLSTLRDLLFLEGVYIPQSQ